MHSVVPSTTAPSLSRPERQPAASVGHGRVLGCPRSRLVDPFPELQLPSVSGKHMRWLHLGNLWAAGDGASLRHDARMWPLTLAGFSRCSRRSRLGDRGALESARFSCAVMLRCSVTNVRSHPISRSIQIAELHPHPGSLHSGFRSGPRWNVQRYSIPHW